MLYFLRASALALAVAGVPATIHAQSATADAAAPSVPADASFAMSAQQMAQHDGWPADVQGKYDALPSAQQAYFWTLDPDQQKGWWAMTGPQRAQVLAMTPDQRAQVWPSIVAQVKGGGSAMEKPRADAASPQNSGMATAQANAESVPPPGAVDAATVAAGTSYAGTTASGALPPPPADSLNKKYPVCTHKLQDNCRNRSGV